MENNDNPREIEIIDDQDLYYYTLPGEPEDLHPIQEVNIKLIRPDYSVVPDFLLNIVTNIDNQSKTTDENGNIYVGKYEVGTVVTVINGYDPTDQTEFVVVPEKDEYVVYLRETEKPVTIILEDKERKRVPNAEIILTNRNDKRYSHFTNEEGKIYVSKAFFTDGEKIPVDINLANHKIKRCHFIYSDKYDEYVITLKEPFNWGCLTRIFAALLLLLLLFIRFDQDIVIETVNIKGEPMSSVLVNYSYTEHQLYKNGEFFYSKTHEAQGYTDTEGTVTFDDQPTCVFSWIFYNLSKAKVIGKRVPFYGDNTFAYHWHFINKPFVLTLRARMNIKVVSARTGQPIQGATVKILTNQEGLDSAVFTTNSQGMCSFEFSKENGMVETLFAGKKGYSGAIRHNILFVNYAHPNMLIVPLDSVMSCSDGTATNRDRMQGGHSVQD